MHTILPAKTTGPTLKEWVLTPTITQSHHSSSTCSLSSTLTTTTISPSTHQHSLTTHKPHNLHHTRRTGQHSTTSTPSELTPHDLSITSLHTVSPNTSRNTSTIANNSHQYQPHSQISSLRDVQSSRYQTRDETQKKLSQSTPANNRSLHTPRLTLAELDGLWKQFLASSLAGTQQQGDSDIKPRCTCGAWRENLRRDEQQSMSEGSDNVRHHSTRTQTSVFGMDKSSGSHKVKGDRRTRLKHRKGHKREALHEERAVQTSPQLPHHPLPPPLPPAPAVTFSLPLHGKVEAQISHLTLSEALAVQNPEFIERSLQRQRILQEHKRDGYLKRSLHHHRATQDRPTPVGGSGKEGMCVTVYI